MKRYFSKDVFGVPYLLKSAICTLAGIITYPGLMWINRFRVKGLENLNGLPPTGVLFVSNHQTYFTDVISLYHIFGAHRWRLRSTRFPLYLLSLRLNTYFIAAEETMKENGILPKLMAKAGAITVKRTWRRSGENIEREVDSQDIDNIQKALNSGWVVTFPQGTTKAWAQGRKGTALLIKQNRPVVVPVVINGFRRAFDKHGLRFKKRRTALQVTIKSPLELDYDADPEVILEEIMDAIEQSDRFRFRHYSR